MADYLSLSMAAKLLVALLLGGMVSFSFFFAPMVFHALPKEQAGSLIGQVFPVYYWSGFVLSAAALLLGGGRVDRIALAAVAALFLAGIFGFLPRIEALRDLANAGDAAAKAAFGRWHGASMAVNLVQMIAVLVVFARMAR